MNTSILLILAGIALVVGLMILQHRRRHRSMQALRREGFRSGKRWTANLTLVTEDGSDRFAVVWPGSFRIFRARQIRTVEVIGHELESANHRYTVVVHLDDADCQSIGLATHNRRDKADRWAEEIREWQEAFRDGAGH